MKSAGLPATIVALLALVAGFAVGTVLHGSADPRVARAFEGLGAVGELWVSALRMIVFPLVVTMTIAAIVGAKGRGSIGALGGRALVLFVALLLAAGVLTLAVAGPAASLIPTDAETAAAFRIRAAEAAPANEAAAARPPSVGAWLKDLVPPNIVEAASGGRILPVLLFAVLLGAGATRLEPEPRELLHRIFEALSDAMMWIVRWVLALLPLGVFALCAGFAFRIGLKATGVVSFFVLLLSGLLLLVTVLLYPVTALLGRVAPGRFARAVAPAQVVAIGTRSSIAALPALVEGGRRHLDLPESATGFVLPLSVATFKINRTVSSLVRLLFLAHILEVPLGPGALASFLLTQLIMSFSTAGIPSAGAIRSLPAYLAAGIPIEAVMVLNAVDTIPDIFATLANVTADMSVATLLSRRERTAAAE